MKVVSLDSHNKLYHQLIFQVSLVTIKLAFCTQLWTLEHCVREGAFLTKIQRVQGQRLILFGCKENHHSLSAVPSVQLLNQPTN